MNKRQVESIGNYSTYLFPHREIALGIYELAAKYVVKDIEEMLEVMYDNALESGWWHNTYAQRSKEAYFVSGPRGQFSFNAASFAQRDIEKKSFLNMNS